jgi:hypothetical protein
MTARRICMPYSKACQWETFLPHDVVSPALLNPSPAPEPGYNDCEHAIVAQSRLQPFLPLPNSPLLSAPEANYKNYSHTYWGCSPFEFYVSGCSRPLTYRWFAKGVKHQPYATRYTEFLENLKNIIPDGMIFQAEFEGDLVVVHVFSYELYDLSLPWGQQSVQPAPAGMCLSLMSYQLNYKLKLIVAGPNLSLVNGPDALGQSFE